MTWTKQTLQRLVCGLHGHDTVLHFERNRISLRCISCGYETPGWTLRGDLRHGVPVTADFSRTHTKTSGRLHRIVEALTTRAA